MKDKRIWPFKRRAEEDNLISAGACRLILRISSWRYCTKHHPADSEFSLSWRHMAAWYDYDGPEAIKDKETIYGWIRELVHHRFLNYRGRKGCPAQSCFQIDLDYKPERLWLFDWAAEQASRIVQQPPSVGGKTPQLDGGKTPQLDGGKTPPSVGGKNRPPHNLYSLREEMYPERKKLQARSARAARSGGKNVGSLRSRGKGTPPLPLSDGQDASAVPTPTAPSKKSHAEDRALSHPDNPSAAARTGGTIPPDRGRKAPVSPAMDTSLHTARVYVEMQTPHYLEERHVAALLKAGEPVPIAAQRKFPKLFGAGGESKRRSARRRASPQAQANRPAS
jgi:hypothetical protein